MSNLTFIENLSSVSDEKAETIKAEVRSAISELVKTSKENGAPVTVMVGLPITRDEESGRLRCGKGKFSNGDPLECDGKLIKQGELTEADKNNLAAARELIQFLEAQGVSAALAVRLFDIRGIPHEHREKSHQRILEDHLQELPELKEFLKGIENLFFLFGSQYSVHARDKHLSKIRNQLRKSRDDHHAWQIMANFFRKTGIMIVDAITLVECRPHLSTAGTRLPNDEEHPEDAFFDPMNLVRASGAAIAVSKTGKGGKSSTTCGITSTGGIMAADRETKKIFQNEAKHSLTVSFLTSSEGFNAARGSATATALQSATNMHLTFLARNKEGEPEITFFSNKRDQDAKDALLEEIKASDKSIILQILGDPKKLKSIFGGIPPKVEEFLELNAKDVELDDKDIEKFRKLKKSLIAKMQHLGLEENDAVAILEDEESTKNFFDKTPDDVQQLIELQQKPNVELSDDEYQKISELKASITKKIMEHDRALSELNAPIIEMMKGLLEGEIRPRLLEQLQASVLEEGDWRHKVQPEGTEAANLARELQNRFRDALEKVGQGGAAVLSANQIGDDGCQEGETCALPGQ